MEYEGIVLFSFSGAIIAWIPNKTSQKWKSQTSIPHKKILNKILAIWIPQYIKNIIHYKHYDLGNTVI